MEKHLSSLFKIFRRIENFRQNLKCEVGICIPLFSFVAKLAIFACMAKRES